MTVPPQAKLDHDLESLLAVKPQHEAAIAVLAAGGTQQDAATAAGVSRETVSRWHKHPGFAARLNEHQATAVQDHNLRLARLRGKALDVVEESLDAGDARVALRVLDALGLSFAR